MENKQGWNFQNVWTSISAATTQDGENQLKSTNFCPKFDDFCLWYIGALSVQKNIFWQCYVQTMENKLGGNFQNVWTIISGTTTPDLENLLKLTNFGPKFDDFCLW